MDELIRLSNATLGQLPGTVKRPSYDRSQLTPGIVHIGVGNFHRAHQAWYLHRLMQAGKAQDWAIIGAGVRPYDAGMRDKLLAQDCLTTLIELTPAEPGAEIVGSMIDYLPVEEGNAALIDKIATPEIRIVALTVTEGGYYIDPVTNAFDQDHPEIIRDAEHPDTPATAFGAIVAALKLRRERNNGPVTLLSCDNLQGNGDVLRQAVVTLARLSDPGLAAWIGDTCSFPNSMVDSIVPATGSREIALAQGFGIDDKVPVAHEDFRQWVMEDDFCAGRPDWEDAGVTFSEGLHTYEMLKLRVLNAGHQVLANPGELLSLATIADCMAHPLILAFFRKLVNTEIVPHLEAAPDMTPEHYVELIDRRFRNPATEDTVRRVAFDGSSRHTGFVLPIVRDGLAEDAPIDGLALAEALWARMCEGTREDGSPIAANDPHWGDLQAAANIARTHPQAWLEQPHIYGDLADNPRFKSAFARWLGLIWSEGCEAALREYGSA